MSHTHYQPSLANWDIQCTISTKQDWHGERSSVAGKIIIDIVS